MNSLIPLQSIEQSLKTYKGLHAPAPEFGADIYAPDFDPGEIVLVSNNGAGNKGIPIRYDHLVIVLCINGQGHRRINHHRFQVMPHLVQIMLPGQIHSFSNITSDFEVYVLLTNISFLSKLHLPPAVLENLLHIDTDCLPSINLSKQEYAVWRTIFDQLDHEHRTQGKFSDEIMANQVFNLLWQIKRSLHAVAPENNKSGRQQGLFSSFRGLIEEHFQTKKTVQDYANLLYISPKHLSETVKQVSNHTALHHIHERIVHEAEYLLVYTNLSVKEIAHALNFENPSHFGRFFRKQKNLTPLKYRTLYK